MNLNLITLNKIIFLFFAMLFVEAHASLNLTVKWQLNREDFGTGCYLYANDLLSNSGKPVDESLCRTVSPTIYEWACSNGGTINCYEYVAQGSLNGAIICQNYFITSTRVGKHIKLLNCDQPVSEHFCLNSSPPPTSCPKPKE